MAAKPLTREEIANTEKKLDMPLDDIIKMSKHPMTKAKQQRAPNKGGKMFNNAAKYKAFKVQGYMNSRPFVRQGALAQRRSNFQGNHFPVTTAVARKAAVAPFHNRPFNRNMMVHSNKARAGAFMVQRKLTTRGDAVKLPQSRQQQPREGNVRQKPQTLDALFANMKEQRMKVMSRRNNNVQRTGSASRSVVPWARGRFAN